MRAKALIGLFVLYNVKIAQLDTFSFQADLGNKMGYLTLLTLGLKHYEAGNYEKAIHHFSEALQWVNEEKTPKEMINSAFIYLCRGNAYLLNRDYDHAFKDYNLAFKLELDPLSSNPVSDSAQKEEAHTKSAIADYDQAIALDAKYAVVYNNRGLAFKLNGDAREAIRNLNRAITIDSLKALFYVNRGATYADEDSFAQAIADFDHAIRLDDKDYSTYFNRGNVYRKTGDYDGAIADFTQTVRLNREYYYAYLNRGNTYLAKGDAKRAIADFDKAIKLHPENYLAYKYRGQAYKDKGDFDGAIADLDRARNIKRDDPEIYGSLEEAYRLKNEQSISRKVLKPSVKHESFDGTQQTAAFDSTYSHAADRFKQTAKPYSQQVRAAEPAISHPESVRNDSTLEQHSELPKLKEDRAITSAPPKETEDFENGNDGVRTYVEESDSNATTHLSRARQYMKKTEYRRAIDNYNKVIQKDPDNAEAYQGRGEAFFWRGAYDLAIKDCTKAIRLKPKAPLTYLLRGYAYEKKGDLKQAVEDFETVLKLNPNDKMRIEAEKRLKKYHSK